jgi:hypothetical protein
MNETSQTTSCGANGSSVSVRAFVRSSTVTRSSRAALVQLAVADVERDHARGAALQQHVGEAAGRRADVEAVEAAGSTPNASSACASLSPPRETYGGGARPRAAPRRPARPACRARHAARP